MVIANNMIIGHLKDQGETQPIRIRLAEVKKVCSTANNFKFNII